MDNDQNRRRAGRNEFPCEIRFRFPGEAEEIIAAVKDISSSGARVIITGRLVKVSDLLEIKIRIKGREIICKGKVAWVLMLRFGMGNVRVFDAGIAFAGMEPADRKFLEDLFKN